ncbi:MAG: hypothetical protein OJF51_001218 [Nitrospira sp.]|nr:MAG: hypothetical protein OJF51_001218 [Nitrospira sp.]
MAQFRLVVCSQPVSNAHDTLDQQASSTELVDSIIIPTTRAGSLPSDPLLVCALVPLGKFKITTFFR